MTFLAVMGSLVLIARSDPGNNLHRVAFLAVALAFFAASVDINVDAYRTELLPEKLLGPGVSLHMTAYRLGMVYGGALCLFLADHWSWQLAYLVIAPGADPGRRGHLPGPRSPRAPSCPAPWGRRWWARSRSSCRAGGPWEVLAFILLYKLGDNLCVALNTPVPPGAGLHQDRDRPGQQGGRHGLPDRRGPGGRRDHGQVEPAPVPVDLRDPADGLHDRGTWPCPWWARATCCCWSRWRWRTPSSPWARWPTWP